MNNVEKVLEIAKAEVGYLEKSKTAYKKDPNILYEKTAGAGSDNYTKYNYELHKIYPTVMDFPAAWCFTEGTMLLTDNGYKPIEEIKIGDKVLNAYGNAFNTVTDIVSRMKRVLDFKAYGSLKMRVTGEHPFLSTKRLGVRKDWKQTELDFNSAEELRHGDNVIIPITKIQNELILTYDEAWIIGYFVGDGWITSKGLYKLCGNDKKETEIMKHIKNLHKDPDYKSRTCHEYVINHDGNENIINILNEVGKGAANKVVPKSIIYASNDIKKAFLDGYITADGTKDYKFSTVSKSLALGIAKIAYDLGYGCSLREQIRNEHQVIYDKRYDKYRDITIKPIIYIGHINKTSDKTHRMDRVVNDLIYVPVQSNVESDIESVVYNISTDGDHTFLANNLAVHNCDCFVDWCFQKAYGIATAKSLLCGDFNDYTVASCSMYQKKGALDTTPTIGAQVFFTRNGQVSGCYHTGLVYAVDNNYFYTIEGNTSGASGVVANGGGVAKKKYQRSKYEGKVLFGHPKYDVPNDGEITRIAKEVIAGKWGTGAVRRASLTEAGYNYAMVQERVNSLLRK